MNKYTRIAKEHGFDHEYEYRNYVKAKCKGNLGEFYLNMCGRSLVKVNRHFESVIRGIQESCGTYINDLRKVFFNCVPVPREYIDREYLVHVDLAPKPDVVVPPIEIIPYENHVHSGKSWMWLKELIAEERAKAENESSGQSS